MQNLETEFAYSYIFSAAHRCVSAKKKQWRRKYPEWSLLSKHLNTLP